MIIEFGAKNFLSFKEGVDISFEIGKAAAKNVSNRNGVSHILCLKGKNGAGKTNILNLLSFFQFVNGYSFDINKPDNGFSCESYFHNTKTAEAYMIFEIANKKYEYELSFTEKEILFESLSLLSRGKKVLFERKDNRLLVKDNAFADLQPIKLRANVGIISLAHQYEIASTNKFYDFFDMKIICNSHAIKAQDDIINYKEVTKYYKYNNDMFNFCKRMLQESDLGIEDITIHEASNSENKHEYFPVFHYKTTSGIKELFFQEQSGGIKKLYKTMFLYFGAIAKGAIAVIDELDLHIHPHLVPQILKLFEDRLINKNNAQLIFTSHLTEIIDTLGKYRTVIVGKEGSESFAYRLDETETSLIRNDRPLSPLYNKGILGGVPKI